MKLVSMERTAKEKKAEQERWNKPMAEDSEYPGGLCLRLGKDEIEKLGIKEMPGVGEEMKIEAMVCVTRVEESASQRGEDRRSIELQVMELALGEPTKPARVEKKPLADAPMTEYAERRKKGEKA